MINILRSERPGQRFTPREPPRRDWQQKHIHLHLHLHLSFPVRRWRSAHPDALRLSRILAALVGATVMALLLFFQGIFDVPGSSPFFPIAFLSFLGGLALAWIAAVALLIEAGRSTPRVRLLLALPSLPILFLLSLSLLRMMPFDTLGTALNGNPLGMILNALLIPFLVVGYPVVSTLLFNRAISQAALVHRWLRDVFKLAYVMVSGMVLLLLSALLWCLTLVLVAPEGLQLLSTWQNWLSLFGMCVAVIVAVYTLFSRPRSSGNAKARPKDASPSDADSSPYTQGYRG